MSAVTIKYYWGGIFVPELGLWLDPHEPQTGPTKVFVSHAHSDHIGAHREVIVTPPTAKLMHARLEMLPAVEHILNFGETKEFGQAHRFRCTLRPAGHIFGSAMALVEYAGASLLYTGDFKLRRGRSAEPCEPCPADILVMETTFARSQYRFPPTEAVLQGIIRFCREALDNDETPVLLGYSLGKCQELLCGLAEAGLPLMLHGSVYELTKIYEQFGQCFPGYERYRPGAAKGKVLLCPPNVANSAMLRNLGPTRSAILTGWAVDPDCKYRYQVDAAFPLSDHADFPDLLQMVKMVAPKKVYTLHGFAAEFAQTLRELGYNAQALSEDEQLALGLGDAGPRPVKALIPATLEQPFVAYATKGCQTAVSPDDPSTFLRFARTCLAIAGTTSKLAKTRILAEYLQSLSPELLPVVTNWFAGFAFAPSQNKVLQLGWALLRDAICSVAQVDEHHLHHVYLKHSDLGETAFEIFSALPAPPLVLTLSDVDILFNQLLAARGPSGKLPVVQRAFRQGSPLEIKYLVKILTGDLRIGLKEGLVEDAVALAFQAPAEMVRQANLLLGNIGETAALARNQNLASAGIVPFRPVKFMLASPEETAQDLWERATSPGAPASRKKIRSKSEQGSAPVEDLAAMRTPATDSLWLEDKYDGIRCQLHKVGARVALYSRDLKDITHTFPDLVASARSLKADVILDGEIVAWRGDQVLPFAELQKRLGRREHDLFMSEEVPIQLVVFDLLWKDSVSLLNAPLRERRQGLEALGPWPAWFRLAQVTPARSVEDIEAAFDAARARNNEGLMAKNPLSPYTPGRRGLAWLKLKKALATLDCVVVGAEYGHGKRSQVLSDYTFAVRDENTGQLKTIGKAYSGLTDAEILELTRHFLSTAVRQHGRYFEVQPDTVLEIAFDRLQPSDRHNSGLAMRFPRIVRIRTDKSIAEIDTLGTARKLVK